jgi:hypothetical protein
MSCDRTTCPIYIVCQKKANPYPQCLDTGKSGKHIRIIHNGYAAMALQEQQLRADAIDYAGDWG